MPDARPVFDRTRRTLSALLASWLFTAAWGQAGEPSIIYAGSAGEATELFGLDLGDRTRHQLTSLGGAAAFPVWSPDGARVAFLAMDGQTANIMLLDRATGDISVAVAGNGNPADWGPRGQRLLITSESAGKRGLFILDLSSGTTRPVDTGGEGDAYARWARTGEWITYESGRDGNPEIYVTHLASGATRRLTENDNLDEWPSLARDASRIAWASGTEEVKDLWVMRVDGSEKRRVTTGLLFGDAFPEWSPDGSQIVLTVREGAGFVLKLVDVESRKIDDLGPGAGASWR